MAAVAALLLHLLQQVRHLKQTLACIMLWLRWQRFCFTKPLFFSCNLRHLRHRSEHLHVFYNVFASLWQDDLPENTVKHDTIRIFFALNMTNHVLHVAANSLTVQAKL